MFADNHHLYYEDEETGEAVEICEEISVEQRNIDLLSGDITLTVALWIRGRKVTFEIERGELSRTIPRKFYDQGLTLTTNRDTAEMVLDYILDTDKDAYEQYVHKQLGFREVDGLTVFLADKPIGQLAPPKNESRSLFPEVTEPRGNLSRWLSFVRTEVVGHVNLELALAIGFSAPVAYLLRKLGAYDEVPIISLVGQSSTGKTTALRLMASIFGSPEESTGLVKDLNATENAFFRSLSDSTGFPLIIDEATCQPTWDFSTVVYNLSKGAEKARCKANGELRERLNFSGAIIISGENSLFDQSMRTPGMSARLVELTLPWTDDAAHARRVSKLTRQIYGTAVYPFMSSLLELYQKHPRILAGLFERELALLQSMVSEVSNVDERNLNIYATITLAAILAKQSLRIPIHIKKLRELLVACHRQKLKNHDPAEQLYDAIKDAVLRNRRYFPITSGSGKSPLLPSDLWGEFATRNGQRVLWITQETFAELAEKAKFGNFKQLLSAMYEKDLLVSFGDRHYTTAHLLGNMSVRCYCLKMEVPPSPKSTPAPKKTVLRSLSPHPDLLQDSDEL